MRKSEIQSGQFYVAPVSGRLTVIKVYQVETRQGPFDRRKTTRIHAVNLRTSRDVQFRSATKIRRLATSEEIERFSV